MTREELLEDVAVLRVLLTTIDRLAPGRVDPELFGFLDRLPQCPVTADLLRAALAPPEDRPPAAKIPGRTQEYRR